MTRPQMDVLDMTLPDGLRNVVTHKQAHANEPDGSQLTEKNTMDLTPETLDAIKTTAAEAAKEVLASKQAEQAVAEKIASLTTAQVTAEKNAEQTAVDLATARETIETLQADNKKVAAELKDVTAKAADLETAKAEADEKVKALEAEKAEAQAALEAEQAKAAVESTIASRTEKLTEAKATDEQIALTTATNEDGTLQVSDTEFDRLVAFLPKVEAGTETTEESETPETPDLKGAAQAAHAIAAINGGAAPASANSVNVYADQFGCE